MLLFKGGRHTNTFKHASKVLETDTYSQSVNNVNGLSTFQSYKIEVKTFGH